MPRRSNRTNRDQDISDRESIQEELLEAWTLIDQAFQDQWDRTNEQLDNLDLFNCKLNDKQRYAGNASAYVPIIHDAIVARSTRFTNQLFPQSNRYVQCVTENGDIPHGLISLMEYYIRKAKLRTNVIPPMLRAGDLEGQFNLYVSWGERDFIGIRRAFEAPKTEDGFDIPDAKPVETRKRKREKVAGPRVCVIPDADVMVLPVTAETVDDALFVGGSVTVIRRWTEGEIDYAEDQGWITEWAASALKMSMADVKQGERRDIIQKHVDAAGIKQSGEIATVYETWIMLKVDDEAQLCRAFYGGDQLILGCKLSPYWKQSAPILSAAREKAPGVFKGRPIVGPVAALQYAANDFLNQALDSATYSLLPIIMTDPEKNPRTGTMVLDLAAVWETDPESTKFAEFPQLYQHAMQLIGAIKSEIFQTLSVNSAMIPQQTGVKTNRKLNQAEIAQEQQVDILSTSEAVSNVEESVLNDMLDWFLWLDHQFRDDEIVVPAFGQMGMRARMQKIEPIQIDHRFFFSWFGVQAARDAAQIQQQIAAINVMRGIPPEMYRGRRLDLVPFIEHMAEAAFGPRLAPLIFQDEIEQLTIDVETENDLLTRGFEMEVHPLDNDQEHIKVHYEAMADGDPHGTKRAHIIKHQNAIQQKAMMQAQMMQAQQQQQMAAMMGQPGMPGGAGPGGPGPAPGVAGTPRQMPMIAGPGGGAPPGMPRIGASPSAGRPPIYNPPGAINPDRMSAAGAVVMPRFGRV